MDSQSIDKSQKQIQPKNILDNEKIQLLKQSQINFQTFLQCIGDYSTTNILQIIKKWHNIKGLDTATTQQVRKICQSRVQKMIKNKKIKKNWRSQDIILLLWIVSKYLQYHKYKRFYQLDSYDWKYISACIPGTNPRMCQFRFLNLHKNKLSAFHWKQEQSLLLAKIVRNKKIIKWKQIAQQFYQTNYDKRKVFRTAKQCRQHWTCYLNPVLKKGPWNQEQDIILLNTIVCNKGIKKWSMMTQKFEGRTQNALKNRFNLLLQKQMIKNPNTKDQISLCKQYLKDKGIIFSQTKIQQGTIQSELKENNMMNEIQYSESQNIIEVKKQEDSVNQYENKIVPLILRNKFQNQNNYWFQQNSDQKQSQS